MHATYAFLVHVDPEDDPVAQAKGEMETYSEHECDENNWWEPMALVLKDGTVLNMADKGDWRGRDEFANEVFGNVPEARVWETALDFVRQLWLGQVHWAITCVTKNYDTPPLEWEEAARTMREVLRDYSMHGDPWALKQLANTIDHFDQVTWDCPFIEGYEDPYQSVYGMSLDYWNDENNPEAIMFVDIHT